jgi:hypothetical protein
MNDREQGPVPPRSLNGRNTHMKKILAAAGIGAALALSSLVGVGTASASTEGFLQEMASPFSTPAEQLAEGNSICAEFTEGRTENKDGAYIITNISNYYASQGRASGYAIRMTAIAVRELCPVNIPYLRAATRSFDAKNGN